MSQPMANKISNSPSNRLSRASPFNQSHHRLNAAASTKPSTAPNELAEPLDSSALAINTDDFKIGDRVWVGGVKPGIIAFIGEVQFAQGEWAGVVLDSPAGKNDGSVNGLRYFMCEPKRGIFSTLTKLTKTYTKNLSSTSEAKNLLEAKVVDSLESNMPDKLQKFANQKYHQKDDSNISSSDLESNNSAKQIPCAASHDKMSYIQSEISATKVNHLELASSSNTANDKRKTSISSSSSQSSGRVDGLLSKINVPFKTGDRVLVSGSKEGIVRFIGEADFAKGVWVGVELKEALGKNDGSVAGKRYFQCAATHGLFAPVHKVEVCRTPVRATPQRQQRSQSSLAGNTVSKSSSHNSNLTNNNRGSQESISSIGSAASSASRRMKLGVTSLSGHRTKGSLYNTPTLSALQKTLKEKEEHIEQLIKERDLDRSEFIRTAAQIDEVEGKLMLMQSEKRRFMEEMDSRLRQAEELIITLEGEKNDLRIQLMEEKRKFEDLQFSLEEANIEKSDIQSQIEKDSTRLKELDEKLKNEMQLNDKLTNEVKSLKMLGLSKDDPIDEYLDQIEELTHKLCVAENRIKAFEMEGAEANSVHLCKNCFQNMSADATENSCDVSNNDHLPVPETKSLKNQLRILTQEKLFAEAQKGELEEDFKKVSAEKDLIELELNNLVEDHKKLLEEKEKLSKERLTNQRIVQEAGIQIKSFEQKVEKLTCDFATRMDALKKRAEAAEKEAHSQKMSSQQISVLKKQVEQLNKQVDTLTKERDSLIAEVQKLKTPKSEGNQIGKSKGSPNEGSFDKSSHNGAGDEAINSIGVGASLIEKLKSEKDFAESQIDFLNAVIVDLQKKNYDLENQLKAAESSRSMTDSLLGSFINSNRSVTLRMFCDICDIFDQHETEDCPMQNMTASQLNASQHHGSRDEERPYCTSCEVFGHTTDECKDEQTY